MGLYGLVLIVVGLWVGLAVVVKSEVVILLEANILVGALLLLYPFLVVYANSRHTVKKQDRLR